LGGMSYAVRENCAVVLNTNHPSDTNDLDTLNNDVQGLNITSWVEETPTLLKTPT
jgi:hypothetical protein